MPIVRKGRRIMMTHPSCTKKYGDEISSGDSIVFLGHPHRIVTIMDSPRDYDPTCRMAFDARGWSIALSETTEYEVI